MKLCVALRAFAKTPDLMPGILEQVEYMRARIGTIGIQTPIVDVVIPVSTQYQDVDCGQTSGFLSKNLSKEGVPVFITRSQMDVFSGILNEVAHKRLGDDYTHLLVVSLSCASYMTELNISRLIEPFGEGAKATGLILPELKELISGGNLTNTFAIWELDALLNVGMFDPRVCNPYKDRFRNKYIQTGLEKDDLVPITGVEVPTLVNLIKKYGRCIAPVVPGETGEWKRPDPKTDPAGHQREVKKMESKAARHLAATLMMGVTPSYIKAGIMPGYPK